MGLNPARASRLVLATACLLLAATATAASAATLDGVSATAASHGGPLTGTWAGVLSGSAHGTAARERIVIVVNAHENAGTWKISATCRGSLTLDSVSAGYHHFRRHTAPGASCLGGDIDCLMRSGGNLYDSVTPHRGGEALSGTLLRRRSG
jgi:hypothetical protein